MPQLGHKKLTSARNREYARAMVAIWLAQILFTASISLLLVLPRLLHEQGIPVGWHGWIMATFGVAYAAGLVSGGPVIRRHGYRLPAVLGCFVAAAGCAGYLAGHGWSAAYFVARAWHGFGCAWIFLSLQGRAMTLSEAHLRGQTMGLANLPGFLTLALSPLIAETMSRRGLSNGVFLVAGCICLALLPIVWSIPPRSRAGAEADAAPPRIDRMSGAEWLALWFCFAQGVAIEFPKVLLPLATASLTGWGFTTFFATYGTTAFLVRALLEKPLRARWPGLVMVALGGLVPVGAWLLAAASTVGAFAAIGALFGVAHGLFYPSLVQLLTRHAHAQFLVDRVSKLTTASIAGVIVGQGAAGVGADVWGIHPALRWGGLSLVGIQATLLIALWYATRVKLCRRPAGKVNHE